MNRVKTWIKWLAASIAPELFGTLRLPPPPPPEKEKEPTYHELNGVAPAKESGLVDLMKRSQRYHEHRMDTEARQSKKDRDKKRGNVWNHLNQR